MAVEGAVGLPASWSSPSPDEVAAAATASDLFLFRRVGDGRFAHIGGVGRGAGWAGIVEIGIAEEPLVADALRSRTLARRFRPEPWHVFGPYYGRAVVIVPVDDDVFAVFGSPEERLLELADDEFRELAGFAGESMSEVAAAKRLADELEVVNAVRDLLRAPASSLEEAMHSVVAQAATSLSCELGVLYVPAPEKVSVFDPSGFVAAGDETVRAAMAEIARRGSFPLCIQDATEKELPLPFCSADGAVSYYLLGFEQPAAAVLLLVHTTAAPRGFTQLCQTLGLRLVEAAGPVLSTALSQDAMRQDLERAAMQARRDPLTGLANRLAWGEAMARAVPAGRPVSIVQLDCHALKQANDTYGHHVGDRLLRRVANVATLCVREDDLVARVGGDEFAILLYDADEAVAAAIVSRIEAALAAEPPIEGIEVAVAVGAATIRDGDLAAAFRLADDRLIAAKRGTA